MKKLNHFSKITKLKLFCLLFILLSVSVAFAQEDSSDLEDLQMIAQEPSNKSNSLQIESQNLNQNSNNESQNVTVSTNNLSQSELESMNAWELLDQLELSLKNSEERLQGLMQSSKSLENELLLTKTELENSKITLASLKAALLSNKDDTSVVISELGQLSEKIKSLQEIIDSLSSVRKRARTISYVELGVCVPCLVLGCLPIWTDGQQNIRNLLLGIGATGTTAGVATFIVTFRF